MVCFYWLFCDFFWFWFVCCCVNVVVCFLFCFSLNLLFCWWIGVSGFIFVYVEFCVLNLYYFDLVNAFILRLTCLCFYFGVGVCCLLVGTMVFWLFVDTIEFLVLKCFGVGCDFGLFLGIFWVCVFWCFVCFLLLRFRFNFCGLFVLLFAWFCCTVGFNWLWFTVDWFCFVYPWF